MFSIEKKPLFGQKVAIHYACICSHQSFWMTTQLKRFSFFSLPLFPVASEHVLKCCKCQREHRPNVIEQLPDKFPRPDIRGVLSGFHGWFMVSLLAFMMLFFYRSIYPDDTHYRAQPRIGDIYFVDFYQISENDQYFTHPYRIAKLIDISGDNLVLKVSGWSHSRKWGVFNDFLNQQYAYKSNYMTNLFTITKSALQSRQSVFGVRRKRQYVDVEEVQKGVVFEKKFEDFPYLE